MIRSRSLVAAVSIVCSFGCSKDKAKAADPASSGVPAAQPAAVASGAPKKELKKGTPASIAGLKLPADAVRVKPSKDPSGYWIMVPAAGKVESDLITSGAWRAITGDGWTMAYKSHNPSGDDPPGCPSVDEMRSKVPDARVVIDEAWGVEPPADNGPVSENPADENAAYLFERKGKYGFYATRVFDNGDDADTYCFTVGDPKTALDLSTLVDRSQAEQMLAVAMSLTYRLDTSPREESKGASPAPSKAASEKAHALKTASVSAPVTHASKAAAPAPKPSHTAH